MPYNVRVDTIAQDITDEVKEMILDFLKTYDFPYVTTISDKFALKQIYIDHFKDRHSLQWLKDKVYASARSRNLKGVAAVAWTETNRLHTVGLGNSLLSKGKKRCTTVHSYGDNPMSSVCRNNLEGKIFDIQEIINNSFPATLDEIKRTDIPMVPQHPNCRHVLAPVEE